MPLTRKQLLARVAYEASSIGTSYLIGDAKELAPLFDEAPELESAAIAIVFARQLTAQGQLVDPQFPEVDHPRLWAVLPDSAAAAGNTGILGEQPAPTGAHAHRVFSPIALMDVDGEAGLVITELAEGISARELQAAVAPTLQISSRLEEIKVDSTPAGYNKS